MAWNPSPEVQVARDAAAKLESLGGNQVEQVVVMYVTAYGKLGMVTYGRTKDLCGDAKRLGDKLWKRTMEAYESGEMERSNRGEAK